MRIEEEASANLSLGNLLYNLAQYDAAYKRFRRAESLFQKLGNQASTATAISNQSLIHVARGDTAGALRATGRAAAISRRIGDRRGLLAAAGKRPMALIRGSSRRGSMKSPGPRTA